MTSPFPTQVMSPTTMFPTSSSTPSFPSPRYSVIRPGHGDTTLGRLLAEVHRDYACYRSPKGVLVSQSSLSVAPVEDNNIDQFSFGVRNTYSVHNKFLAISQAEKLVDRSGQFDECNSSNAQIRTLFDEQRQMIIAEYCEKIGHH